MLFLLFGFRSLFAFPLRFEPCPSSWNPTIYYVLPDFDHGWRRLIGGLYSVFKIIEERSSGAEEQMASLEERIESLEKQNQELKLRLRCSLPEAEWKWAGSNFMRSIFLCCVWGHHSLWPRPQDLPQPSTNAPNFYDTNEFPNIYVDSLYHLQSIVFE